MLIDLLDDPEYMDYLEYIRAKRGNKIPSGVEGFGKPNDKANDQFNESCFLLQQDFSS